MCHPIFRELRGDLPAQELLDGGIRPTKQRLLCGLGRHNLFPPGGLFADEIPDTFRGGGNGLSVDQSIIGGHFAILRQPAFAERG
jgi:hypothetical protein